MNDDQKKSVVAGAGDKVVGKTEDGKPIYEGPRGGKYTLNDKGEKVYQRSDKKP